MTFEKAIEEVQFNMSRIGLGARAARRVKEAKEMAIEALKKVQAFEAIGTIEELKALKEKSVAKKAALQATTEKTHYKCPCCNNIMQTIYRDGVAWGHIANYCEWCGQALET